ncbi:hypothetical protein OE88DRAFT_1651514 [Heliocybe sulcata]|uniref:ATP-dependent DNA helicase n=1 Tax=Heliocybe sulcata TaxID=5364 RepID=A0A5C3NVA7_9AGAM|nr:hypothetical protein OE88DRAFT_1651514 [Heliocybe sulcata]
MPKVKYYAVKIGREGPKIYSSWDECKDNTQRIPGAVHKSFTTRSQAEAWLNEPVKNVVPMYWRTMPDSDGWPLPTGLSATSVIQSPDDLKRPDTPGPSILEKRPDWDHEADFLPFEEAPNKIVLSDEQEAILNLVQQGKNVFFTGSAGTGKSVLLREIIRSCESRGMRKGKELAVTASTGIASVNIGGMTIHSWAGIGQGEDKATDLAKRIIHSPRHGPRNRWRTVQTLVVDESQSI